MSNKLSMGVGLLVLFILGLGFGSVFLPQTVIRTSTQTTTQATTSITTLTITTNSSISLVTATVVMQQIYPYVATCTTINGTRSIIFVNVPGEITTWTTVYPSHLPQEYQVTQVTVSTYTTNRDVTAAAGNTC